MKTTRWLLLITSCIFTLLVLNFVLYRSASTQAVAHPMLITTTPTATLSVPVTCTTHTTGMTLTLSSLSPQVGDTLVATATLANEGCAPIGLPQYTLWLGPDPNSVLTATSPTKVLHSLGLDYGETDVAAFTLKVIGAGMTELNVFASFEVHTDVGAYWGASATGPLTVTVPATDTEILVMQQAAQTLGCETEVVKVDDHYSFACVVAAGHSLDAHIERFADAVSAHAEFAARQGTLLLESFHCYSAYSWAYTQTAMPMREAGHTWLGDRWIFSAHSVDDTGIPVAPSPYAASEALYRDAFMQRLLPACDRLYLPVVQRW